MQTYYSLRVGAGIRSHANALAPSHTLTPIPIIIFNNDVVFTVMNVRPPRRRRVRYIYMSKLARVVYADVDMDSYIVGASVT